MAAVEARTCGELLRRYRRQAGLSQEELAERAELSPRGLRYLERGERSPYPGTIRRLADALGLSEIERERLLVLGKEEQTEDMAPPRDLSLRSSVQIFLVADIRGYTRFTFEYGDAKAAKLAERFATLCEDVVEEHEGQVTELRGDEALSVFPSARNALRAAIALQHSFQEATDQDPSLPMRVGIGLDAGEPVPVRGGYRGGALNLAARLCSIAKAGEVLASETVSELARKTEGVDVVDRGEVSLKGLLVPIRVMQIGREGDLPASLPPLQPVLQAHPTNLPDESTPFIGREREIAQIASSFQEPHIRLVTLTGTGGSGKTRLALQVAGTLLYEFRDGAFVVSLAPLIDPSLVPSAIAEVLHLNEEPGTRPIETLAGYLRDKHLLIVLDNYEHLLDAREVVAQLLDDCRELHVLVTSRVPLHLSREREHAVPPLTVPDLVHLPAPEELARYESVSLFCKRARSVKDSFTLTENNASVVAEICARLDGLPLAIELAAARIKLLPAHAVLQRLSSRLRLLTGGARDRPDRQQTLRRTIDWSYSLLSPEEQALFARLSVFVGGWTCEAAEAVCNPEGDLDVFEGLASLVDKSLVQQDGDEEPEFSLLETVREYATEKLDVRGESDVLGEAHATHFLELAEEAEPHLTGPEQSVWMDRLQREHDNLRAALRWSLDKRESETAMRLTAALWRFWSGRGYLDEGLRWIDEVLRDRDGVPPELVGKVLVGAGELATYASSVERSYAYNKESLELHRQLGDKHGMAMALNYLAVNVFIDAQNHESSIAYFRESLALARQTDDMRFTAEVMGNLGLAFLNYGDIDEGRRLNEDSLRSLLEQGDKVAAGRVYDNLARAALLSNDWVRAGNLWASGISLLRERSEPRQIRCMLEGLAAVAAQQGDVARVARIAGAAAAIRLAFGCPATIDEQDAYDRHVEPVHQSADPDTWEAAWHEGQAMSLEQAIAYALDETAGD